MVEEGSHSTRDVLDQFTYAVAISEGVSAAIMRTEVRSLEDLEITKKKIDYKLVLVFKKTAQATRVLIEHCIPRSDEVCNHNAALSPQCAFKNGKQRVQDTEMWCATADKAVSKYEEN